MPDTTPISTSGKWVDSDGNVVDSEPVEGRLLVAPGSPLTPDVLATITRAEEAAPAKATAEPDDYSDAESADAKPAKADDTETATAAPVGRETASKRR